MPTPPLDLGDLPTAPGVYRFREATGRVLYIGRATDLRRRVRSYWGSQRGRPRMRRMVPKVGRVELVVCASEHEAAWLERNLLEQSRPAWNRARGGLETPVYLRLDPGPRSPSLTVAHEPVGDLRHFGPYLGGNRVRTALSALDTLYPLAYSAEQLAGSARAMAEARGIVSADRPALLTALTAVLEREPEAARSAQRTLEARRASAAKDLEFELAGRIHDQVGALVWLTSPQRVTGQRPLEATAVGWADGTLVEFGIRAGRVRTWRRRPAPRADAEAALAATPPEWRAFAQDNANVAARLRAAHDV